MRKKNKHLLIVNYAYEDILNDPSSLLQRYHMLTLWAEACAHAGMKVTVFQRFKSNQVLSENSVRYCFIRDNLPPRISYYHCAMHFNNKIKQFVKTVAVNDKAAQICMHINGLIFPVSVLQLTYGLPKDVRAVIQYHAELPGNRLFRVLSRLANKWARYIFFTTKTHALPWIQTQSVESGKVVELMECSSKCILSGKNSAQNKLAHEGRPLILWAGNLDANKDPLTILSGFEEFLSDYPDARLIMLYRFAGLHDQVKEKISGSEALRHSVTMVGSVDYTEISDYYNAADIFVQGSAREGSGIAVLDALACGAIPVVTSIPSFAVLTDNGAVGALWLNAQVDQFVFALKKVMSKDLVEQQHACVNLFERKWSIDKIITQAKDYYYG